MTRCLYCDRVESSRWYKNKTQCAGCNKKEWYAKNKEKAKQSSAEWHAKNSDRVAETKARWFQRNKQDLYEKRRQKLESDLSFKISCNLRSRLANAIRNRSKGGSAVADLGCSIEELRSHLEKLWEPGMSWENYGKGKDRWNIDHAVPLCSFDLSVHEQLRQACHYTNLRPLWEKDNLLKVKHDKDKKNSN
jgi:hypothetical protein